MVSSNNFRIILLVGTMFTVTVSNNVTLPCKVPVLDGSIKYIKFEHIASK